MKKICFFMNSPFTLGGEQRVVTILANYLVNHNYEVSFLLTDRFQKQDYEMYKLDKKIKLNFVLKYNKFFNRVVRKFYKKLGVFNSKKGIIKNRLSLLKKIYCNGFDKKILANVINKEKYDFVIGIGSEYFSILVILKPFLSNSKIVAWEHSCFNAYFKTKGRRFYNQNALIKYLFNNIDYYVVQTDDDRKKIENNYKYSAITLNNPNSFKTLEISDLTTKNFVAVGRYTFVKCFDELIEAFHLFSKNNSEWNLYIVGEGDDRKKYQDIINKYNLNKRIFLTGQVIDVPKYYLNSSIYVMTSSWEGWGMVVTEAMAYGLPIISYDIPSSREIFGKSNCGILIEKNNVSQLASAMNYLANNELKIKEMSKESLSQVKKFDIEKIGKQWIKLIFKGDINEN